MLTPTYRKREKYVQWEAGKEAMNADRKKVLLNI
jgi:hypothetical protein